MGSCIFSLKDENNVFIISWLLSKANSFMNSFKAYHFKANLDLIWLLLKEGIDTTKCDHGEEVKLWNYEIKVVLSENLDQISNWKV